MVAGIDARIAMHASTQALHACAHMRHTSSSISMQASMHIWHIATHASSMAIMTAGVMPFMRIIDRIMVLHMSAQFMHAGAQSIISIAQIVQACSHAEQASIHACIVDMSIDSMPGIDIMSLLMTSIIIASMPVRLPPRSGGQVRPTWGQASPEFRRGRWVDVPQPL